MLPFHNQILTTHTTSPSSLLLLARGLGTQKIIEYILHLYAAPECLVVVVNCGDPDALADAMTTAGIPLPGLRNITNTTNSQRRKQIYLQGGVLAITSRILVVDMLNELIPTEIITGIVIVDAHKVANEESTEHFILRIYRQRNKTGFIQAITDQPEQIVNGFSGLQKSLKFLFLKEAHFWPRFHPAVVKSLEDHHISVIEVRVSLSTAMKQIQAGIIEVMDTCIMEIRKANNQIDWDDMTVEGALDKNFSYLMRKKLGAWHRVPTKTKILVEDLNVLRKLLFYLVQYDAVSFHSFLQSVFTTKSRDKNPSQWLYMDAADTILKLAKGRVLADATTPAIEVQPKWKALKGIIDEIDLEDGGEILVMCADAKGAKQIAALLEVGEGNLLDRLLQRHFEWQSSYQGIEAKEEAILKEKERNKPENKWQKPSTDSNSSRGGTANKRRRTRGGAAAVPPRPAAQTEQSALSFLLECNDPNLLSNLDFYEGDNSYVPPPSEFIPGLEIPEQLESSFHLYSYTLPPNLDMLRPTFVILMDPSPAFIRQLEIYKAEHPEIPLRVYFMLYDNSVEEQLYLSGIRREKEAFETGIREARMMVIPEHQDGINVPQDTEENFLRALSNPRVLGGGRLLKEVHSVVIVDVREFRSSLPSICHSKNMKIIPVTLEVGDYVITPTICIERKSVSDLIQSLNTGRLYTQAETMSSCYECPILLIEFDSDSNFALQTLGNETTEISSNTTTSKLVLFTLHFPKFRIIWSSSPHQTADILLDLKKGHDEPDVESAMRLSNESASGLVSSLELYVQDFLLSVPGLTQTNFRRILQGCNNLLELTDISGEKLEEILGDANSAQTVLNFLHVDKRGEKGTVPKVVEGRKRR